MLFLEKLNKKGIGKIFYWVFWKSEWNLCLILLELYFMIGYVIIGNIWYNLSLDVLFFFFILMFRMVNFFIKLIRLCVMVWNIR